jgi:transposase
MIVVCGGGFKTKPNTHQMKSKRRRHDPEFKARVALEALKGIKTIQQISKEFDIHPVKVSEWKKTMAQGAASVFGSDSAKTEAEDFQLHAKIGQQAVELDWLTKKSKQLGL